MDRDRVGRNRGREIYESHESLWSVSVFADASVSDEQREVIRAYLAEQLGVQWDSEAPRPSLDEIAAAKVAREKNLPHEVQRKLSLEQAARGGKNETFSDLVARKEVTAAALAGDTKPAQNASIKISPAAVRLPKRGGAAQPESPSKDQLSLERAPSARAAIGRPERSDEDGE
jgi:hypothetical protein